VVNSSGEGLVASGAVASHSMSQPNTQQHAPPAVATFYRGRTWNSPWIAYFVVDYTLN